MTSLIILLLAAFAAYFVYRRTRSAIWGAVSFIAAVMFLPLAMDQVMKLISPTFTQSITTSTCSC